MNKKYEHIGILPLELPPGPNPKLRVETGETFEFDMAPELETFLLQVGLIREALTSRTPVTATPPSKPMKLTTKDEA